MKIPLNLTDDNTLKKPAILGMVKLCNCNSLNQKGTSRVSHDGQTDFAECFYEILKQKNVLT